MPVQRRRGRLDGETRNQRTGPIDWSPTELALVTSAAEARRQSVATFIASSALGVATGRFGPVTANGVQGLTPELVIEIHRLAEEMVDVRRLLANAAGSLNQLAAAANSGNAPSTPAVESAVRYLVEQLQRHDVGVAGLVDLIEPD